MKNAYRRIARFLQVEKIKFRGGDYRIDSRDAGEAYVYHVAERIADILQASDKGFDKDEFLKEVSTK